MGAPPSNSADITNVTCPFCGLLCDDLTVASQRGALRVTGGACAIGAREFGSAPAPSAPIARISGRDVPLHQAIAEAARLIGAAHQPVIGGLATDLAGVRAAARLADRVGGVVDHMNSAASLRNLLVLQDGGWITTTLSEVRNHADLLVVVGSDLSRRHPRFFERVLGQRETLYGTDRRCDVVLLGSPLSPGMNLPGVTAAAIPCELAGLAEGLGCLRALVSGRTPNQELAGGVPRGTWEELARKVLAAKYAVFVWAAADLDFPHAELTIQTLAELIKDVNRTTRAAGLPLSGADGETTVDAVLHWQTGYGARTSFGRGYPSHDSYHLGADRLLEHKQGDLLLWVASFDASRVPPASDAPRIVLGRSDMAFEHAPEVFIAVGIPGVDHAGHLFRSDRVIALPLAGVRQNQLPTAAYVLDRLATALGAP
jgi:formylmethanofuran dehydrogenase subunit B